MDLVTASKVSGYPIEGVELPFRGTTYTVKRWNPAESAQNDKAYEKFVASRQKRLDAAEKKAETTGEPVGIDIDDWRLEEAAWWLERVIGKEQGAHLIATAREDWVPPKGYDGADGGGPFGVRDIVQMVTTMTGMAQGRFDANGRPDPKGNA